MAIGAPKANARVGYLELVKESDGERLYREFIEGLQSHGYVEGRNLQVVRRSARAKPERLTPLAVELAAARVDVILAASIPGRGTAKVAAPGVPTVFLISGRPRPRRVW